jgi:hypothetical protein
MYRDEKDGRYGAEVRIGEITQGATKLYEPPFNSQDQDDNIGICRTIQPYLQRIAGLLSHDQPSPEAYTAHIRCSSARIPES